MSTHGPQIMSDVNIVRMDLFWIFWRKKILMDLIAPFSNFVSIYNSLNIVDFKNMKFFLVLKFI